MRSSIFVLAVVVAGCVSSGTKVTQEQAAAFEVGKTTEAQIIAALGAPNQSSTLSDGTRLDIYMHISAHANAASYIPVVGLVAGGAKGTNDTATFTFTPDRVLKSTSSSSGTTNVNTGLANQH
jgi:outer membrane protein assembly factor BamE (lipoprotein component of BamABCDE complex)